MLAKGKLKKDDSILSEASEMALLSAASINPLLSYVEVIPNVVEIKKLNP